MKAKKLKIPMMACALALVVMACEKESLTYNEDREADGLKMATLPGDTSISVIPDIVIDDSVLQNNAFVSQYCEDFLTYTYDRAGRLAYINYIKRNTPQPVSSSDIASRYVYMQDKFVYSNTGKLIELTRFNLAYNSFLTSIMVTKSYKYNQSGKLAVIITRWPNSPAGWEKTEYLYYDNLGNMVEKIIKDPDNGLYKFIYSYDKENRLIRMAGYGDESSRLHFVCNLFYDSMDNIERKEFYYPYPWAASVNDVERRWVVYYKYDNCLNPFRDFKLPVSSLFEWMDVISPSNITAISFNSNSIDRVVFYKYRYNTPNYPVLRYRVNLLPLDV